MSKKILSTDITRCREAKLNRASSIEDSSPSIKNDNPKLSVMSKEKVVCWVSFLFATLSKLKRPSTT